MIIVAWLISTALWLGVWIPFYLLGFVSTWLGLLFCNRDSEHMAFPWWFWDSNAGINGTIDYMNLNWVYICNPQVNWNVPDPTKLAMEIVDSKQGNERKYKNRWIWVTWRNPVTNVSRWLIGMGLPGAIKEKTWKLGPLSCQRLLSGVRWSYSLALNYGNGRCFFYRFGWKLDDPQQGRCCFMYRISPWKAL